MHFVPDTKIAFKKSDFLTRGDVSKYFEEIFLTENYYITEENNFFNVEFCMIDIVANMDFDMQFCDGHKDNLCLKQKSCKRYLDYQKIKNTKYAHNILISMNTIIDKDCEKFKPIN